MWAPPIATLCVMYKLYNAYSWHMESDEPSISASDARAELGKLVNASRYGGQHTVITKAGQPHAVLVPFDWWEAQRAKER